MAIQSLDQFLATAGALTSAQRTMLIDQAIVYIDDLYVHLPLKKAMHAIDPVQRLHNLKARMAPLSERQFHDEMIAIFTSLRDLHTNYLLPDPYAGKIAFLPFLLEEYFNGETRHYLVTKMLAGFTHLTFGPGAEVTSWSGAPIDRAVEANADKQAGSNLDARHARGLESMTIRDLTQSSPPDEHWVIVTYIPAAGGAPQEIRLDWKVLAPDPSPNAVDPNNAEAPAARALGYDASTEARRRAKKLLFNPDAMRVEEQVGRSAAEDDVSSMPDVFAFKTVTTPRGTFGYVRIWTFMVDDDDAFLKEFVTILGKLPSDGVIVDVRGNGGGNLFCAERALQLFTPHEVQPTLLSMIATPLTVQLCDSKEGTRVGLQAWRESMDQANQVGANYSLSLALDGPATFNSLGQHYQGPAVLIIDPLCYSATDMFSVGFRDNALGPIVGTAGNTGAGGANVWTDKLFRQVFPGKMFPFKALPKNAALRVAFRRTTRQGAAAGTPVEDLGVVPDSIHLMTKNDVLDGNVDLINAAGRVLAAQPIRKLMAAPGPVANGKSKVALVTAGIDRVDLAVDDRPVTSVDVTDGSSSATVPTPTGAKQLRADGFQAGQLVVRTVAAL